MVQRSRVQLGAANDKGVVNVLVRLKLIQRFLQTPGFQDLWASAKKEWSVLINTPRARVKTVTRV